MALYPSLLLVALIACCLLSLSSSFLVPPSLLLHSRRPHSSLNLRRSGGRPKGPLRTVVTHVPINSEVLTFLDERCPPSPASSSPPDHDVRVTTSSSAVVLLLEGLLRQGLVKGKTLAGFDPVPKHKGKGKGGGGKAPVSSSAAAAADDEEEEEEEDKAPAHDVGEDAAADADHRDDKAELPSRPPGVFPPALPPGKDYQLGVLPLSAALYLASTCSLDLVMLSPGSSPPLLKIVNYSKHLYDSQKALKSSSKASASSSLKELKMTYSISPNDYAVRLRSATSFLTSNSRVRLVVPLKGREVSHAELGEQLLAKMLKDLDAVGEGEGPPRREGRAVEVCVKPRPEVVRKARKDKEDKTATMNTAGGGDGKKEDGGKIGSRGKEALPLLDGVPTVSGSTRQRTTSVVSDADPGSALS